MAHNTAFFDDASPDPLHRPVRPIDLVHLARQCLGDAGLEHEILRLFDTTAKTYFERLQLSTTFDELAMNLHSLKGAASGVGAWAVADLAKAAETELKAGRPLNPERIADIGIAVEEVSTFITEMLSKAPE
ncbi:MAG TPA: Hpt domain-containing protein [Devosia sp.]|nr:Hpt domain-containing protein [Devosia sp.]